MQHTEKENEQSVEDRVVDTYRRSSTRMRERTRHRSGNIRFRFTSGVTRHRRRLTRHRINTPPKDDPTARPEA